MNWELWYVFLMFAVILCTYNLLVAATIIEKNQQSKITNKENEKTDIVTKYNIIIFLFSLALCFVFLLIGVWRGNVFFFYINFLLLSVIFFEKIMQATDTVFEIIFGLGLSTEKMTIRKYYLVMFFCNMSLLLISTPITSIEMFIKQLSSLENSYIKEIGITAVLYLCIFLPLFTCMISMTLPLKQVLLFKDRIDKNFKKNKQRIFIYTKKFGSRFIIKIMSDSSIFAKTMYCLIIIPLFIFDVIIGICEIICNFIIESFCNIIKIIAFFSKISLFWLKIYKNSFDVIVSYFFKLCLIITDVMLVVIFRINNPYNFEDNYLLIFEFISSVILIPLIFDWITSNRIINNT